MSKRLLLLCGPIGALNYLIYLFTSWSLFEHIYTILALVFVLFACVYLRPFVYRYQMVALWIFALMSLINYLGWGLFGNSQDELSSFVYLLSQMMAVLCCVIAYLFSLMGMAFKDGDRVLGWCGVICLLLLVVSIMLPSCPEHLHQALFVAVWGGYAYGCYKD